MRSFWCLASRLFVAAKHLFNISIFSYSTYLGDPASPLAPDSTGASQFLRGQSQVAIIAEKGAVLRLRRQGDVMKKVLLTVLEPTPSTLLIAFAIGLGIAVYPVFFLAALVTAIAALIPSLVNAARHLTHRHP
jgi:hypothetical protein